jgi:hypothetical protein
VQNAAGCTASTSQLVTVNALPTAGITGTTTICSGTTTTLTGTGGTQYNWGSGFSGTATFTTPTLTGNATYIVTVQNAAGCTASISQLVTVNANPILSSSFVSPLCNGNTNGSIDLSISGLTPSITFDGTINEAAWGSALATSSGGPSAGFGAGHEVNALYATADETYSYFGIAGNVQSGNRILLFLDSKTGGYNTANFNRTNSPAGLALFNSGTTFDAGFSPDYCLVIGTNGSGTYYYDLFTLAATGVNNFLGSTGAGLGTNPANSNNTRGFEVRIPNSSLGYVGGGMKAFAAYISDATGFLSNQFLTRANSGEGNYGNGVVAFGAASPNPLSTPNVTYAWSNSATTQDLGNIGAGTYTVTVTAANTCTSTASVTVTQPTALSASIVSVVHDLCLYGLGSIQITATGGTAPYTVTRTPAQGTFTPSNIISTSGGTTSVINISGGTTLNVTVTDTNGCHVP